MPGGLRPGGRPRLQCLRLNPDACRRARVRGGTCLRKRVPCCHPPGREEVREKNDRDMANPGTALILESNSSATRMAALQRRGDSYKDFRFIAGHLEALPLSLLRYHIADKDRAPPLRRPLFVETQIA